MPSVNLRLSDEQHAELIEMAKRENRSLQREIVYRLFGRFNQEPPAIVHTVADAESRDVRARTLETPSLPNPRGEVEPDFKPQKKR
jgi:hypothetical protein